MYGSIVVGGRGKPDGVVVGQFKGEALDNGSAEVDPLGWAGWTSAQDEATGEAGSVVIVTPPEGPGRVLLVGLGDRAGFEAGVLREAGAAAVREGTRLGLGSLELRLEAALETLDDPPPDDTSGRAFGEGAGLAAWRCETFRGSATEQTGAGGTLELRCKHKALARGVEAGLVFAEGSNLARTLSQTPPNIATPMWVAGEARRLAAETGLECTVLKGEQLDQERLVGLSTVGAASENEPCLIRVEYTPAEDDGAGPIVLIGKTITYDSGGLSIKTGGSMRGMKRDMDGGAAVLGAMLAIARQVRPSRRVVGLLAAAENAISDEAYRPDDILTFRNGVTVEVTNTDAEGRLVLADALCWACDEEKPSAIIDMATLTGGVVVALGSVFAGMWCDDDGLRGAVEAAAQATGERVWRLPHDSAYDEMMRSSVADITNSAPVREAHAIQAAAFLSYFCADGVPWAHLDIAGMHVAESKPGLFEAGPTGYGARLAAEAVSRLAGGG